MSVQRVNFEPMTDILKVHRRDFPLADPTLADPMNLVHLVDGEWMTLDATYKILRATDVTTEGAVASKPSFPLFAERGRYDVRAIAGTKMPILFRGEYEFDTRIYNAAANINGAGNPAINTVLMPLKVMTISIDGRFYTGLVGHGGSGDTDPIVGYVTRLPAANNQKLRFISGSRH